MSFLVVSALATVVSFLVESTLVESAFVESTPAAEPLPDREQAPASEEDQVREIMMNRAGLK